MRRIILTGLGALLAVALYLPQAQALMVAPECTSDADCEEGFFCDAECPDIACEDENDPACECWGWCSFIDDGDYPEPENECETDADCTDGFACVEAQGPVFATDVPANSTDPAAEPCPEGEKCDDEGDEGSGGEPVEMVPAPEPDPEATTWKYCEPKSCDTDAECGGELVCVLETYACLDAPTKMAPTRDCPPDEEDCGETDPGPDTETDPDPCEPETVGHCAPKWLAPCDADADCGPGFSCVEEEICMGWSTGSGSTGGMKVPPTEPTDCDPDDEDCATDDSGEGENADPVDPEGEGDEPTSGQECELTGHFYCELQNIDCSEDACPDGLDCIEMRDPDGEACWQTSEGESNCPDGEPTDGMLQICAPEDFEDWIGAGMSGGGYGETTLYNDDGNSDPEAPSPEDGDQSADGGSGSGGGCAGGSPSAPMSGFALALLALGLVTRRRT